MDLFSDNIPTYNNSMDEKALLYIFQPRQISNQAIFPLVYDFKPALIEKVVDNLQAADYNNPASLNDPLLVASSILPSGDNINLQTSKYSQYYTFMLIVDGKKNINTVTTNSEDMLVYKPPTNYRIIYLGFFNEEPVNPNSLYQATPTFNYRALMQITRKSIFKKIININQAPNNILRPNIISDQLVTSYDKDLLNDKDDLLYLLNPENIDYNSEGIGSLGYEDTINVHDNIGVETLWQSPKRHLKNLTSAISDGYFISINNEDDLFYEDESFKENVLLSFKTNDNSANIAEVHNIGFAKDQILALSNVISSVDPDIIVVKNNNKSNQFSAVDSNYISPETIYGSTIESTVSGYLLKWGLSSISLSYDSYSNGLEIHNIEAAEQCTQEELKNRFNNFWMNLNREILSFIKAACGDFYLNMFSHISSNNLINLIFYDYKSLGSEDYIVNFNPLGGIGANNQLGKGDHVIKNINDVSLLLNHTSNALNLQ